MKVFIHLLILLFGAGSVLVNAQAVEEGLTLNKAVDIAITADPWLAGSRHTQAALSDEATAAATVALAQHSVSNLMNVRMEVPRVIMRSQIILSDRPRVYRSNYFGLGAGTTLAGVASDCVAS